MSPNTILTDSSELFELKNGKNRLLGMDVGDKTIGLSLSDITWTIASPYKLIKRKMNIQDVKAIQEVLQTFPIAALVVGLPLNMNGTEGSQAQKVRGFVEKLLNIIDLPVFFWDERLSTVAVTRTLLEADLSRKRRQEVVDKMAATFILQGVLDRLGGG